VDRNRSRPDRKIVNNALPSQKRFHNSKARFKGFSGPIGSGKSQALCQEAIRLTYLNPGRTGLIGAPTYPTDVNATAFNSAFNFPPAAWTPSSLAILKTECLGYTLARDLDECAASIDFGASLGFTASHRSHLVGISDSTTPWLKEAQMAEGKGLESVVLFALDQYCLIGYATPLPQSFRRSLRMGN